MIPTASRHTRSLLRLGFPVLLTELGVITVSFADTMMVGAYGTPELAAAAFVNNLFMVPILMLIGFASGLTPLIGALYTENRPYDAGRTYRTALRLNLALSLLLTTVMGALYFALHLMGQPPELLPLIRRYYIIVLLTLVPTSAFNCCQQMSNGVTDTAMPMWVILGANSLNILGNYILIFGHWGAPELGLAGAGISTLVCRVAGAVAIYVMILHRGRFRVYREGFRARVRDAALRLKVLRTSYPVMIQSGIECMMWSFGAVVCGWFGTVELAAYQVVVTISQLGFMTYISFGIATSIKVANYMGERDTESIRGVTRSGMRINLALCTLASVVFVVFGRNLLGLFTDDSAVVGVGMGLLAPLVIYQYSDAVQIVYANALRGTSDVKPLLWASVVSYVGIGVPVQLMLAVALSMQAAGVYYSFCVALVCAAVMLHRAYVRAVRRADIRFGKES